MAVKTVQDPVSGNDITMIEGVISRIMFKEAKPNQYGTTHNASVQIDNDWINFISLKVKEGREPQLVKISGQAPNLTYTDINEGDTVRVVVKVGEYNGKPAYTSGSSKFNILKKGEGKPAQQSNAKAVVANASKLTASKASGTKVYGTITDISNGVATNQDEDKDGNIKSEVKVVLGAKESEVTVGGRLTANIDEAGNISSGFKAYGPKDDDVGVRVGNAFNVAVDAGLITGKSDIVADLPEIVAKLDAAREEAAKANPTLSQRALGGRFGLSVVTASKFAKKGATVEDLIEAAKPIFLALGQVEDVVRSGANGQKLEATKTVSTAEEPKEEDDPFPGQSSQVGEMDFDDDIPF